MESDGLVCGGEEADVGWEAAGASELTLKTPWEAGQAWLGLGQSPWEQQGEASRGPQTWATPCVLG